MAVQRGAAPTPRRLAPRVLIAGGPYGIGNRGDDAILDGIVRSIRASGLDADLSAIARLAGGTGRPASVVRPGIPLLPLSAAGVARGLAGAGAVVIGGGSVLADHAGGSRWKGLVRYPGYPLACATWAALMRRPFVFFGVGVEPMRWRPMRRWTRWACARSALVAVRDTGSAENLESLGVPRDRFVVCADPAITIADAPALAEARRGKGEWRGPPLVALGISIDHDTASVARYEGFWRAVAQWLVERLGARILAVEMDVRPRYDEVGSRWVREALGQTGSIEVLPASATGEEVARAVACADLVVTSRMHLAILAAAGGVPYVSIRRNRKLADLDASLGWEAGIEMVDLGLEALDRCVRLARAPGSMERLAGRVRDLGERVYALGLRLRAIVEGGA